jgi:hypothetical protein
LSIITDAGSSSKEQGNFIIKEAINSMMTFWDTPFAPGQDKHCPGILEADGRKVAAWVQTQSFAAQMVSLFPVTMANEVCELQGKMSSKGLVYGVVELAGLSCMHDGGWLAAGGRIC